MAKKVDPPAGFRDNFLFLGRQVRIDYYDNLENEEHAGETETCSKDIKIAIGGLRPELLADLLWHEINHLVTSYLPDNPEDEAQALISELCWPQILRDNRWIRRLYS